MIIGKRHFLDIEKIVQMKRALFDVNCLKFAGPFMA